MEGATVGLSSGTSDDSKYGRLANDVAREINYSKMAFPGLCMVLRFSNRSLNQLALPSLSAASLQNVTRGEFPNIPVWY